MKKYYTPSIEEFHVGFEFEFQHSDYPESGWIEYDTPELNWELEDCPFGKKDLSEYRVKYLDKQDIESLGWVFVWAEDVPSFRKEDVILSWWTNTVKIRINLTTGWQLFDGFVKNKSELKKLMQQLGI